MSQPTRALVTAWETFLVLLVLTLVHRLLTFAPLAGPLNLYSREGFDAWLVGTLSDLWTAYLGGLLTLLLAGLGRLLGWARLPRLFQAVLLAAVAVSGALHVAYVDFFHIQIIPFHLRYLSDPEFIQANGTALFAWKVVVSAAAWPLAWWLTRRARWLHTWSNSQLGTGFAILTIACGVAHNRNIHFREQWFTPDNLQVNALERLYLHLNASRVPPAFARAQIEAAAEAVSTSAPPVTAPLATQLFSLITKPAGAASSPLLATLQEVFAEDVAAQQKPVILVILLESMRPAETGYFAPDAGPSLTPTLDKLAATGLVFSHAYSTGSVTRGAQEAAFCGYLGSRSTSLMRGEAAARMTCLPDLIAATPSSKPNHGTTLWLHGGDPRFDGQVEFWRRHGLADFLSLRDFPADAPRTGWGVGDKAFFHAASEKLLQLRQQTEAAYVLAMALSVTNHIPWDLPMDAGMESVAPRTNGHPSYATTAYADGALGGFVEALKTAGVWPHALVIVASDHGTLAPPLVDLYQGQRHPDLLLASHINFLINGGLMSRALQRQNLTSLRVDRQVSQADIAPLIADVAGIEGRFMGENPLAPVRHLPVVSDLEQLLLDHGSDRAFSAKELTKESLQAAPGGADATSLAPNERKALLFYQAFLQYIYLPR